MESSLTSFTPLGLTFGILFDVFRHLICLTFEEIYHVSQCSHDFLFTPADAVLKLDVVSRFSGMMFVFVNLPEVLVVIPRAVPTSVVLERVVLLVPRREIFFPLFGIQVSLYC